MTGGLHSVGRIETGHVAEQRVSVGCPGGAHLFRRIRVKRHQATRDGDRVLYLLTNAFRKASAKRVARLYKALDAGDRVPASRSVLPFGN